MREWARQCHPKMRPVAAGPGGTGNFYLAVSPAAATLADCRFNGSAKAVYVGSIPTLASLC